MTQPEVAELVRDALRQTYGGYFEDWVEKGIVVADALLARLRPTWDTLQHEADLLAFQRDVNAKQHDDVRKESDALRADLAEEKRIAKDAVDHAVWCNRQLGQREADLRACAEALRHALESEDPSEWDSEAHAALALPGVKELLT